MAAMKPTFVNMTDECRAELGRLAEATGLAMSDFVRAFVEDRLGIAPKSPRERFNRQVVAQAAPPRIAGAAPPLPAPPVDPRGGPSAE